MKNSFFNKNKKYFKIISSLFILYLTHNLYESGENKIG